MTNAMWKRFLLLAAFVVAAAPASAQDAEWRDRQNALTGLAGIFGELHHVRRMCEPRYEANIWRDRMKKMIDLEEPSFDMREMMVKAFNQGYTAAQNRFDFCDRNAEDYAAARAVEGERLVAGLTRPLYEAMRGEDAEGVTVWRGATDQQR
jgi:uncharacterized protein (TIGR02301 family)